MPHDKADQPEIVWSPVTHATPRKRDVTYDPRAQQAAVLIELHHSDGSTSETVLILTPDEMHVHAIQLDQAIERRKAEKGGL